MGMEKTNKYFDRFAAFLAAKLFPKTFNNLSENLRNITASRDLLIKEAEAEREVQETLRRSERFLSKVFDSIHDPFIILDRDYRIVKGNEAYASIRNIPLIDLLDEKCHKVFHGKDGVCDDCIVEKTFRSSDPCAMDKLVRSKNGTEAWFDIYTYPIIGEDGKVSHVIEYLRDITDRKRTDKALRESEERYKRFVELSLDGIFKVNTDGDFIQMNKAGARIFGYETSEEMIGKNALEYWRDPKDRDAYREELKIRKSVSSYPMKARKKNGEPVELESSSRIIEDENGNFQGIEGILRDVTERNLMEGELRSLSLRDDLTGLYNRRGFIALATQELKMADRLKKGIFVLYADLDGLKSINDTLGHKEGDKAIKETAIILNKTFRNSDIIGRIGGDEFVIIPIGTAGDNLEVITSRLQKNIDIQNETIDRTYKLSLSVGIAYYDPKNPLTIDELLTLADAGMYEQKRNKRNA
jgi:diguanylate cyclase (GGDEF)-like protein/PAS domain S-box-containing protein